MSDLIKTVSVLTEQQCQRVYDVLYEVRHAWIDRNTASPGSVCTLGIATYLDAANPDKRLECYATKVRANNAMLSAHFAHVYELIKDRLCKCLNVRADYTDEFALPGFHIFREQGMNHFGSIKPHFDCQYQRHPTFANLKDPDAITFTLPIRLPSVGGGLDYWRATLKQFEAQREKGTVSTIEEFTHAAPQQVLDYMPGLLVIHTDLVLHRIAAPRTIPNDGDERITLQGHGIKAENDQWVLYW